MKSCFFNGHREAGGDVFPALSEAVEHHITEHGVTDFYVGHYGGFDGLAAQAVKEARERHPEIRLTLVLPYHPAIRPINTPKGISMVHFIPGRKNASQSGWLLSRPISAWWTPATI